jgi:hypothetical protein
MSTGAAATWIAEEHVVFIHPDGTRRPGRIALAAPVQRAGRYTCEVALDGMQPNMAIHGGSTLQALLLAAGVLGMRLHDFVARGGRVLYAPGEESDGSEDVALEALFGCYFRAAPPLPPDVQS